MGKGEGKYTIAKEPREMSVRELKKRMAGLRQEKKETFIEEVEIQTKYSLPFACFVFGLFGAPLGIKVHRSGKRGGLGIGLIIVIADYIFLLAGQALGREGRVSPVIALWLPNILIGGLGIYLLNRISKEAMPFEFMMKLSEFIEKVRR